ncbi:igA protease [Streptomyces laurentii]|uniref:IgA protease n=1 Tax=Streptomyces laurentii TaxID=39478 RepID=A0A160P1Z4_STRLU|nr:igA protease [Streptomyces laurentii]
MNSVQIRSAERALSVGTWLIVCGAMLYSVLTVTPLMRDHTADGWKWTAPILPIVVDAAVVIVVRLDSTLARIGGHGGRWSVVLRWMTGAMTLALNVADSALAKDLVGVAVHAVAPLLLIVTAETSLAYRRAITSALDAMKARQRAERAEQQREAEEREERAERRAREEREHAALLAREQREHEAALAREQSEREERARREERERAEAAERARQAERERAEREREQQQAARERAEREREQQRKAREQQAAQQRENERRKREEAALREQQRIEREQAEQAERAERERAALLAAGPAEKKQDDDVALQTVTAAFHAGLSVRQAAELCGWSTGWVSTRYQELRDTNTVTALEGASA